MKHYDAKILLKDADKGENARRFRNILANSGKIMESGEIRELDDLYVMGFDSELYKISDLNTNPDKQTEKYAVKAQADHGELIDGELVPTIEKQFGSCKVWLEGDGLHARMYFANNDRLADHAWAISEDASYSTGIDWFPDGYYGTGYEIDRPIGILREISMVLTGNDPRAKTIDTKKPETEAQSGRVEGDDGDVKVKEGEKVMSKDELTRDERDALVNELTGVVEKFTADVPESETEPTARDTKDDAEEAAEKVEEKKDSKVLHQPVVIIKDSAVRQPAGEVKADWRFSVEAKRKFADLAHAHNGFRGAFMADWTKELRAHGASTNDGITGLSLPVDTRQLIIDALEKSDGIISHFRNLGGKSYLINLITVAEEGAETARAHGHKKGDTKIFQELLATPRNIYNKMVYKMLDLDAMEIYENPGIVEIRARELVQFLIIEIERAAVIGDGRTAPEGSNPDLRMFDGTRGFYSMLADAQATEGFGTLMATSVSAPEGSTLYEVAVIGDNAIDAEGGRILVTKKSLIQALRLEKTANGFLVQPGASIEGVLGVDRVYAPKWFENASVDAIMFANNSYGLTGEATPTMRPDFNVMTNTDVLLAEQPRGGSLIAYKAAAAITIGGASE